MVTGFNSDVEHAGAVFHVQTEEKGVRNPVVVTLVYRGGAIVTAVESSYEELLGDEPVDPDEIRRRMREQHDASIRAIQRGRYSPQVVPFGHGLISNRSLDEVVLDYLEQSIDAVQRSLQPEPDAAEGTGRVLRRLESFLAAAQRAREAAQEATAVVGSPEANTEMDLVVHTPVPREAPPAPALPAPRRRRGRWFAAAAIVLVAGAAGIALRHRPRVTSTPAVPEKIDAIVQDVAVTARGDEQRAVGAGAPRPSERVEARVPVSSGAGSDAELGEAPPPPLPAPISRPERTDPAARTEVALAEASTAATVPDPVRPEPVPEPLRDPANGPSEMAPVQPLVPPPVPLEETSEAEAGALVDLAEVDLPPDPRRRPLPRYTRRARRLQQEGTVRIAVLVDEQGHVDEVRLLAGIPDSDLGEVVVDVAQGWEFSPARKNGKPVRVWLEASFDFEIRPDRSTSVRIQE